MKLILNFKFLILIIFFLYTLYPISYTHPAFAASEEQAIYNLNNGIFPDEVKAKQEPTDILTVIRNFIGNLFNGIFKIQPSNTEKTFSQSDNLQQATIPDKYREIKKNDLPSTLKQFLGGSTGFYGEELPTELQTTDVGQSEKNYEQVNFPQGINPITQ